MTKRLIGQQNLDTMDEELADLFRAAAPFQIDPFRKRRVLVSMQRQQARRSRSFWLRPALVAALLVSGTAAAALGHRYVAEAARLFGLGAPLPSAATLMVAHGHAHVASRLPEAKRVAIVTDEPPAAPAEVLEPPAPTRSNKHARGADSEDATRIVAAIQALRTERDPARARGLLDGYLKSHPNGALSEDAWALSIEAASAQHDPRAADYARRYLARFARGKYRDLATRALSQQR